MAFIRIFPSVIFTSLPALFWGVLAIRSNTGEYYWPVYFSVCGVMFAVSVLNGLLFALVFKGLWARHSAIFIFLQGALAWLISGFILTLLNMTPLCVGQDNGDGNNDVGLCLFQTALVLLFYSPMEFLLLVLSALAGGLVMRAAARI